MMQRNVLILLLALVAAACDLLDAPTPTPERVLSGPTLEASPVFVPLVITSVPFDEVIQGQNDPTAAALAPGEALPPLAVGSPAAVGGMQAVLVTGEDGAQLPGDLYQSGDERQPGVLLLATDPASWGDFPSRVHEAGFTVLVMSPRDASRLADMRVMLLALSSGLADPGSLAVVGAGRDADTALLGCSGDLLCDTAVLLSPTQGETLVNTMAGYNPRPIFLSASQDDAAAFPVIEALQAAATGEILFQPFDSAGAGTTLLVNRPDLGDLIIAWLQRQLGG